ncbi:DUF4343 domain-containing protein [Flavobacterium album]|uniref:DUF4343 domain-containing protein n=1 Tax=Flavobacterium album TaxID=2175091 RepID=A0A2S1R2Z2_9FLAO|nr:ATP-grasp domain-containing protein [Flavobacterium album]AWH87015.1 DUF4343 domain-containing protein [Flavobacterium album]
MYYIIQENIFEEPNYNKIFEELERRNIPYEIVKIMPFAEAFEFGTFHTNVFVYGSVKLAKMAQKYDWYPGSFYGGNHSFEIYSKYYGEHLLNHDSIIYKLSDTLEWKVGEQKFIRPAKDAKVFTGKKFTETKWKDFVEQALTSMPQTLLNNNTLIQVSYPKTIIKEARIWIVEGKVITSSYYLFHGDLPFEEKVSEDALAFAQKMAEIYEVADAFVMDVCLTSEGWKIVEVNCVNSAGFYKADVGLLIDALERKFNQISQ